MTIEVPHGSRVPRRAGLIFAVPAVLAGWIAVLSAVTYFSESAPAYLVMFPSATLMNDLPEGAAIVERSVASVTLASESPDFAKSLYARGAWVVLPAGLTGCVAPKNGKAVL